MDAKGYEARHKKIDARLAGIEDERANCKRLEREVGRMNEEAYYQNQHDRHFLEEMSYRWAGDPAMAALVADGAFFCEGLVQEANAFAEEGGQAFKDKLKKLRWEEEDCREEKKAIRIAFEDSQGTSPARYPERRI